MHEPIELRGTYRYASPAALEHALASARAQIDDDDHAELEPDWLRAVIRHGTTLRVDARLPAASDRFLAAAVLDALAAAAIEGVVEARRGGAALDWFVAQNTAGTYRSRGIGPRR
ncbi:MAG TPA: hypothetical protein VLX92_06645 [Kofleriaceae bacterium]|nr:hypothetical protein [Kofleriaceae bacterium]